MNSTRCPAREELSYWLDEQLDSARRVKIERHVNSCGQCQEILEQLTRGDAHALDGLGRDLSNGFQLDTSVATELSTQGEHGSGFSEDYQHRCLEAQPTVPREWASDPEPHQDPTEDPVDAKQTTRDRPAPDPDQTVAPSSSDAQLDAGRKSLDGRSTISGYDLLEVIAQGGMGVV